MDIKLHIFQLQEGADIKKEKANLDKNNDN